MREPLINDEEPRGAGDAFIESMTARSRSGDAFIGARVTIY